MCRMRFIRNVFKIDCKVIIFSSYMQVYAHKKSQKLFLDRWVYGVGCKVIKVSKDIKVIKDYKDYKDYKDCKDDVRNTANR